MYGTIFQWNIVYKNMWYTVYNQFWPKAQSFLILFLEYFQKGSMCSKSSEALYMSWFFSVHLNNLARKILDSNVFLFNTLKIVFYYSTLILHNLITMKSLWDGADLLLISRSYYNIFLDLVFLTFCHHMHGYKLAFFYSVSHCMKSVNSLHEYLSLV